MQKQLGKEPRSILMSSADRVAISMGNSLPIIVSNAALQRSINAKVADRAIHLRMFAGVSVFT